MTTLCKGAQGGNPGSVTNTDKAEVYGRKEAGGLRTAASTRRNPGRKTNCPKKEKGLAIKTPKRRTTPGHSKDQHRVVRKGEMQTFLRTSSIFFGGIKAVQKRGGWALKVGGSLGTEIGASKKKGENRSTCCK